MAKVRPISLTILIFAFALFASYHIYYYCLNNYHQNIVDNYYEEIIEHNPQEEKEIVKKNNNLLGILSIPKINLRKELYKVDSQENDVNKNIEILKTSKMPDIKGGTIFLAGHSGNSYLGYFKNIKDLAINDEIIIYYHNMEYNYVINNIYEMDKNGYIEINKNIDDNYLVLTTCHNDKQLVITSKLLTK